MRGRRSGSRGRRSRHGRLQRRRPRRLRQRLGALPLGTLGSAVLRVVAARDARDAARETGHGPAVGETPHRDVPVRVRDHLGRSPFVPDARGGSLRRRLRRRGSLRRASPRASLLLPRPSFLLLRASLRLFLLLAPSFRALRLVNLVLDVVRSLRGAREDGIARRLPRSCVREVPLVRVIVVEPGRGAHQARAPPSPSPRPPAAPRSARHGGPLEDVEAVAVGAARAGAR